VKRLGERIQKTLVIIQQRVFCLFEYYTPDLKLAVQRATILCVLFSTEAEKRLIVWEEYILRISENRLLTLVLVPEADSDRKLNENM